MALLEQLSSYIYIYGLCDLPEDCSSMLYGVYAIMVVVIIVVLGEIVS